MVNDVNPAHASATKAGAPADAAASPSTGANVATKSASTATKDARPVVAAVVINSVSHDGRVIKEAESLTRAGYDVTIVGIQDHRDARPSNVLPSGVRIVRVDIKPLRDRYFRTLIYIGLAALALLVVAACVLVAVLTQRWTGLPWLTGTLIFGGAAAVGLAAVTARWIEVRRAARRRDEAFDGDDSANRGVGWRAARHGYHAARKAYAAGRWAYGAGRRSAWWVTSRTVRVLARPWVVDPARRDTIIAELASINPAIVHGHDLSGLQIAAAYKKRHGGVVVYDSHELIEEVAGMKGLRRRAYRRRQRKCSAFVDRFITINDSIADTLRQRYPRLPAATIVMNATRREASPEPYDGRLHEAAGLERSTQILLYQGGFSPHRGLTQLVAAAPDLPDGWALVMMGWGNLEEELKAQARKADPEQSKIRFIPGAPLAELMRWTCGGDIGAIPYENVCMNHWFCTPNKLWEYPNAGVPILASPFPEMRKIVEGRDVGWLLDDPVTPGRIAEVIGAISDDELAQKKANCRRFIDADNWSVYEERLVKMYQGIETTSAKP